MCLISEAEKLLKGFLSLNNSDFLKFLIFLLFFLQVAIKYIKKLKINDETEINRIRREIKIMSKLNHPNIINVLEGEVMTPGVIIIMMSQTYM